MAMFRMSGEVESRTPVDTKTNNDYEPSAYCDICLECWDSETEVEIHRNTIHRTKLMRLLRDSTKNVCRLCVKSFEDKEQLLEHIKVVHLYSSPDAVRVEREIFICDSCTAVFFNKQLLQAHILIFHSNLNRMNTYTECPKCLRSYRLKTMWYHFQGHNIQSVSCCKICLTKCKDKRDLSRHISEHTKHLFCDTCQYQSKSEAFYKEHLATRHRRVDSAPLNSNIKWKPYFLPRFPEFKHKLPYDTPIKGVLLQTFFKSQLRLCILCREICIGDSNAIAHLQTAHTQPEKPRAGHICNCGEVFNNKVLLKHHIFKNKGTHTEVKEVSEPEVTEAEVPEVVYAIVMLPSESDEPSTT